MNKQTEVITESIGSNNPSGHPSLSILLMQTCPRFFKHTKRTNNISQQLPCPAPPYSFCKRCQHATHLHIRLPSILLSTPSHATCAPHPHIHSHLNAEDHQIKRQHCQPANETCNHTHDAQQPAPISQAPTWTCASSKQATQAAG